MKDDEEVRRMKMIRVRNEGVLPSDGATAKGYEDDEAKEEEAKEEEAGKKELENVFCEPEANEEEDDVLSSAPSSPLYEPHIHPEYIGEICKPTDLETFKVYCQHQAAFEEKLAGKMKLPTLDGSFSSFCPVEEELYHGHQPAAIKAARKFVFALSSSIGGECSGFFIGWDERDESHETGIILTSAHLICSKQPSLDSWLCRDVYAPDAEVIVHFPDRTTSKGKLCYYQKHYNIALFSTKMKPDLQLPLFNDNINCGQKLLMLGRDKSSVLKINHGRVQFQNPCIFERHHFMYTHGAAPECGIGRPIIDFNGAIAGMSTPDSEVSFVPTSVLLKCFDLWRKHKRIPRPHLQLKLCAIQFLDPAHSERIWLDCGVEEGLIIKEVSYRSMAENHGIRVGDIVESLNGECITSLVQLEIMLLHLSQQHLDKRNNDDSEIDIELGIFRTRIRR